MNYRIKYLVEKTKYSREKLMTFLGIDEEELNNIEKSEYKLDNRQKKVIAEFFDVSVDFLNNGEPQKPKEKSIYRVVHNEERGTF